MIDGRISHSVSEVAGSAERVKPGGPRHRSNVAGSGGFSQSSGAGPDSPEAAGGPPRARVFPGGTT